MFAGRAIGRGRTEAAGLSPGAGGRLRHRRQEEAWGWICVSPWILGFLFFTAGPMLFSLYISTMNWAGIGPMRFIGLTNWRNVFLDPDTLMSFRATFLYAVFAVPSGMIAGLAVALLLNQEVHGKSFLRAIYFSPSVVSGLATMYVFLLMFGDASLLNGVLHQFGLPPVPWLTSPGWARFSLIVMHLWGVGSSMIIYLAGLKAVPSHLYEAARIDGAGSTRCFFSITLPMLTPTLFFTLTTGIISTLQIFTAGYVFGQGPENSTYFIVLRIWNAAFRWYRMSFAAALAWLLFAVILAITGLQFLLSRYWVYYESTV